MSSKFRTILNRSKNILLYGKYIPTEYFINHKMELVYIPIPKVACTAIKISLFDQSLEETDGYDDYMNIHHHLAKQHRYRLTASENRYFKFAFVRDPFTRLVSCYKDKVQKEQQHNGRYYFDTAYNKKLIKHLFGNCFHVDMSFADFVELVSKIPDYLADGHFMSQTAFLYRFNKRVPDYVGKLESIDQDWSVLAQRFDLPKLGIKNTTEKADLSLFYTDDLVDMVYRRYKDDIHNFGYQNEYQKLYSQFNSIET